MADTTNFGWTKPTVGGDNNAWGTKLNTLFDDVDADLQVVADALEAGLADIVALETISGSQQKTIYISSEAFQPNDDEDDIIYGSGSGAYLRGDQDGNLWAPLTLPVGAVLDSVDVYCDKQANTSISVDVIAVSLAGTPASIGTGSRSASGVGAASVAAIAHTVAAEFIKVKVGPIGSFQFRLYGMKVTYTKSDISESL